MGPSAATQAIGPRRNSLRINPSSLTTDPYEGIMGHIRRGDRASSGCFQKENGMKAETSCPLAYIRQTKSFMDSLKAEIRAHPQFTELSGEVEVEHRKGEESARHSIYHARWELQGPRGTVAIHASFANDFGYGLTTRLTLTTPGTASAEAVFGVPGAHESSVRNTAPTIRSWIDIITNSPVNPFEGASLPSASR